jgi:hypothetical protein
VKAPSKPKKVNRDLQLADDWQWLATTAVGQRIIADLMMWCEVYTTIEENDPIALARAVGAENVAKRVAFLLGLKPGQFADKAWFDTELSNRLMRDNEHFN